MNPYLDLNYTKAFSTSDAYYKSSNFTLNWHFLDPGKAAEGPYSRWFTLLESGTNHQTSNSAQL